MEKMLQELRDHKTCGRSLCQWLAVPVGLWVMLVSANLVDYFATQHILSHGGRELNPLVALLFQVQDFNAVLATKMFFLAMLLVLLPFIQRWKLVLLAMTTFVYLVLNTYQICGTYICGMM